MRCRLSDRRSRLWSVSDPAEPMIRAVGLRKSFVSKQGTVEAVKGIDVEVRRGESFGFLGPNGAGKSSTMRMIAAVSPVSGGELRSWAWTRRPTGRASVRRIGVCPQEDTLDTELNVCDNLYVYGRYFGLPRAEVRQRCEELLEFVQLTEKAKAKVEDLSGGMKRRLTIARSLINRPEVLLLDEPTTGLDPQARHVVWDRLFRLKQQGVTHRADHPLHGRGRAALRPPGGDGQGADRGRGLARRADPGALHPRGGRAPLRRRGARARSPPRSRTSPSGWRCCPTGCCSTPRRRGDDRQGARARARPGRCRWCAAPRWRTSSCGSPAGRWSTDEHDRHRPRGQHRPPTARWPGPAGWPTTGPRSTAAPGRAA